VIIDELKFEELKTKVMAATLNSLVGESSALVLMPTKDASYDNVTRAGNNIPDAKILLASYVNIRDLLGYQKVVMPLQTLDILSAQLGKE
jgi:large subunit ribosomal protein L4